MSGILRDTLHEWFPLNKNSSGVGGILWSTLGFETVQKLCRREGSAVMHDCLVSFIQSNRFHHNGTHWPPAFGKKNIKEYIMHAYNMQRGTMSFSHGLVEHFATTPLDLQSFKRGLFLIVPVVTRYVDNKYDKA